MNLLTLVLAVAQGASGDTAYFQQRADYQVEATLDESAHLLHARARLTYTNNSPNRLDTLYFHLHLNAFRPNSAWARRELQDNNRRFQDLGPDDHAFERLKFVRIGGRDLPLIYPGAPDSTVVAIPLPAPIPAGGTVIVDMDWDARLSTLPRRQGRRDRHYDFAQWFPKVAVYDRGGWQTHALMPQGEFYGEFGSFDVTLDVAADQVIGATGVPVSGDPGWQQAAAPGTGEIRSRRDVDTTLPGSLRGALNDVPAAGRKRVRWLADTVHHFAWSTSPAYIYEGGSWNGIAIHVLYQPGDTAWDDGAVVKRTTTALQWLDRVWGKYPYPQVTNVHRIEGGGTEFPMMVMNGGPDLGLILHEVGHIYAFGILANNEWKEGFLDEGMTSFISSWYFEEHPADVPPALLAGATTAEEKAAAIWRSTVLGAAQAEKSGRGQPVATPAIEFREFAVYNYETYTKPAIVYRMLREYLGKDVMLRAMHLYYGRHKLKHVTENDFRRAMEDASGQKLDWFFDQWFHSNATLDWSVESVTAQERANGGWIVMVTVTRTGEAWMPVVLQAGEQRTVIDSRDRRVTLELTTAQKPSEVILDPQYVLLDVEPANNRKAL